MPPCPNCQNTSTVKRDVFLISDRDFKRVINPDNFSVRWSQLPVNICNSCGVWFST